MQQDLSSDGEVLHVIEWKQNFVDPSHNKLEHEAHTLTPSSFTGQFPSPWSKDAASLKSLSVLTVGFYRQSAARKCRQAPRDLFLQKVWHFCYPLLWFLSSPGTSHYNEKAWCHNQLRTGATETLSVMKLQCNVHKCFMEGLGWWTKRNGLKVATVWVKKLGGGSDGTNLHLQERYADVWRDGIWMMERCDDSFFPKYR